MPTFENLSLDSIVDDNDIMDLFGDTETQEDITPESGSETDETEDHNNEETTDEIDTDEVSPEDLFDLDNHEDEQEKPENVVSEEDQKDQKDKGGKDATSDESSSSSNDFSYSSIATAFAEEGILPDLDEDTIKNVKTSEDLRKLIDDHIKNELDEKQKRVTEALESGVEPDQIKQYENIINNLNNVSEDFLKEESENAANVRQQLIYNDFINRGYSDERAKKEVARSIKLGSDIEDALEALTSNKEYYTESYNDLIEDAKVEREKQQTETKKKAEEIKKNIMDSKTTFFGELNPDKGTRQKIYDTITKPVYKDPKTGEYLTEIQKYQQEHGQEFYAKVGILYALTNGFENLDGLTKDKVKKEVKKGFKNLESKIQNSDRDSYGNLKFASGSLGEDGLGKGVRILA